jgi:hypothetical protein
MAKDKETPSFTPGSEREVHSRSSFVSGHSPVLIGICKDSHLCFLKLLKNNRKAFKAPCLGWGRAEDSVRIAVAFSELESVLGKFFEEKFTHHPLRTTVCILPSAPNLSCANRLLDGCSHRTGSYSSIPSPTSTLISPSSTTCSPRAGYHRIPTQAIRECHRFRGPMGLELPPF